MGEVYRARDTKLNCDVAMKVLSEAFTTDPERLARFRREAAHVPVPAATMKTWTAERLRRS